MYPPAAQPVASLKPRELANLLDHLNPSQMRIMLSYLVSASPDMSDCALAVSVTPLVVTPR